MQKQNEMKKVIRHPAEILIHACVFLKYWAGLHKEEMQAGLLEGVKTLLACAHRAMAQQTVAALMLPAPHSAVVMRRRMNEDSVPSCFNRAI